MSGVNLAHGELFPDLPGGGASRPAVARLFTAQFDAGACKWRPCASSVYTHSCIRLEHDNRVLVIDPGIWSEPRALLGADAVLVTHEHVDHADVLRLAGLGVPVYAPAEANRRDGGSRLNDDRRSVSPLLSPAELLPRTCTAYRFARVASLFAGSKAG